MTLPDERTRALLWAGSFFVELAGDRKVPVAVRQRAVAIARHFPTIEDVTRMSLFQHSPGLGFGLVSPQEVPAWEDSCKCGPLRHSTRLQWPEDEEAN